MSSKSSSSSSSSSGAHFRPFSLGEDGFRSCDIDILPPVGGESRVSASSYRNSVPKKRLHALAMWFFVPADQELIIPRGRDTVLHPPVGYCAVYVDHFKAGLRLPLFPFLLDILIHYELALSQLVSNAIRTLIAFQLFCDRKRVRCSIALFRHFFLVKSAGSLGWYAFSSQSSSLNVKVPSKNADWKDKFLYFRLPETSEVRSRWNLGKQSDRLDDSLVIPGFDALEGSGSHRVLLSNFSKSTLV